MINENRNKLALKNTYVALINQATTMMCAFVLPRQMLLAYGSTTNGLVVSISQFLTFINLLDMGVSTVVQASLYKPLVNKDTVKQNQILSASRRFFGGISVILVVYTVLLIFLYPRYFNSEADTRESACLIVAISFSLLCEYLFGISNQALLNADQRAYVQFELRIITLILNTVVCVIMMRLGSSVVMVKTVSAFLFLIRPIGMELYVRKKYKINFKEKYDKNPINQKWNGFAHHLAAFVFGNTDVAVITVFATLQDVSIYSVYTLVVSGLNALYASVLTGVGTLFGELYAKEEIEKLKSVFSIVEWGSHNAAVFLYGCTGILLTNFVMIYTNSIEDTNYFQPVLASILTIAYGICCLRNVYNKIICAAGHFKQTQWASMIEAILNVFISLVLVKKYGLVGVAFGTLVAVLFQIVFYIIYLKNNIVFIGLKKSFKQLGVDALSIGIIYILGNRIHVLVYSYRELICEIAKVGGLTLLVLLIINILFYKKNIDEIMRLLRRES